MKLKVCFLLKIRLTKIFLKKLNAALEKLPGAYFEGVYDWSDTGSTDWLTRKFYQKKYCNSHTPKTLSKTVRCPFAKSGKS
jgi:hypothetical protein